MIINQSNIKALRWKDILGFMIPILFMVQGCDSNTHNKQAVTTATADSIPVISVPEQTAAELSVDSLPVDTLDILVVQCANGYEYAMGGYDFNPLIEQELNRFENMNVLPFRYQDLMGVHYQGVFDKKYCPPILEKVDADVLILTRFVQQYLGPERDEFDWGYELRIVNAETLEQVNSIHADDLENYEGIEQHIQANIEMLKSDIEHLLKRS